MDPYNSLADFVKLATGRTLNNYQQECIKDMKAWPKKTNSPTYQIDVAKDFQDKYESSNNGEYWGEYFDGATYNRPIGSNTVYPTKCKTTISTDDFVKAKKALEKANIPQANFVCTFPNNYPVPVSNFFEFDCPKQQEGINPMRSYNDTYASASISNPKSDAAVQRDYLTQQLNNAARTKSSTFPGLFNIYIDNTPKTFKDLIDAIKNDKFTIDPKAEKRIADWNTDEDGPCYYGPLHGIIFAGPQPDRKGYDAAQVDAEKQKTAAERIIVTGDAAAGLAALEAFEAWQPTVATATVN